MNPRLEYDGSYIEIAGFYHETKTDVPESHFNCKFDIMVKSGMYSGYANGCEYGYVLLQELISELEDLVYGRRKTVSFCDTEMGNRIEFEADRTGHIRVSGNIHEVGDDHSMTFAFMTDQTAFPPFIAALKEL